MEIKDRAIKTELTEYVPKCPNKDLRIQVHEFISNADHKFVAICSEFTTHINKYVVYGKTEGKVLELVGLMENNDSKSLLESDNPRYVKDVIYRDEYQGYRY